VPLLVDMVLRRTVLPLPLPIILIPLRVIEIGLLMMKVPDFRNMVPPDARFVLSVDTSDEKLLFDMTAPVVPCFAL
jgi:hypothetical protein